MNATIPATKTPFIRPMRNDSDVRSSKLARRRRGMGESMR